MSREKKQFNIYLPTSFIREVKRAAIDAHDHGMSLSDFVEEALRVYLQLAATPEGRETIKRTHKELK
jgi:predicted HicB family RNase H-like nuclease